MLRRDASRGRRSPAVLAIHGDELFAADPADGTKKVPPFGTAAVFSSDTAFLAYAIGQSEAEQETLRADQKPVQNRSGVRTLATGETTTTDLANDDGDYRWSSGTAETDHIETAQEQMVVPL
jgi:hypothetical protein